MAKKKFFYGWIIVFAGFLIGGASIGVLNNCNSIFVKPVTEDLGFLRSQFTLYPTIVTMVSMILMPFFGELYVRYDLKKILLGGTLVCSTIPFGYALCTEIWQFYLLAAIYGGALNGFSMNAVGVLVNNWFTDKKGTAVGISFAGSGLFGALMIPLVNFVIEGYGWQWGYRVMGITSLLLTVPTIFLLVKCHPSDMGLKPYTDGDAKEEKRLPKRGVYRETALHSKCFRFICGGYFCFGIAMMGIQGHSVAYLSDIGYSSHFASMVASCMMFALVFGKMSLGMLFDRVGPGKGIAIAIICEFLAVACLFCTRYHQGFALGYVLACGMAGAVGSVGTNYLASSYFGTLDFSRIMPLVVMPSSLGSALGSPLAGAIFDLTGSYDVEWMICGVSSLLALLSFMLADKAGKSIVFEEEVI